MNHRETINAFLGPCKEWTSDKYETEMILNADSAPKIPVKITGHPLVDHIGTWFVFKWINPETGITPAQEFVRDHPDRRDWRDIVKYMSQMEYGKYRVVDVRDDKTGSVTSLRTGKTHPAIFRVKHVTMQKNDIIAGYMHPWYDGQYVTAGTIVTVESGI